MRVARYPLPHGKQKPTLSCPAGCALPLEAEEALLDPDQVPARGHPRPGERRRAVIGRTAAGRMLYVVYVEHADIIYIVTAYQAHDREKRQYRRGR